MMLLARLGMDRRGVVAGGLESGKESSGSPETAFA
jgi:hypothetical protein